MYLFIYLLIHLFIYINIFFLADFPSEVSSLSLPSDHSLPERCRVTGCDNFAAFDRHGHCEDCFKRFYLEVIYHEKFIQRQISEISGGSNRKSFVSSTIQKVRASTHRRQSIELDILYSSSSGKGLWWGIEFSYMDTAKVEKSFLTKQSVKDNISEFAESIIQR